MPLFTGQGLLPESCFFTFIGTQITGESCKRADFDSPGLEWAWVSPFQMSSQVMLSLLVQGPYFEWQGPGICIYLIVVLISWLGQWSVRGCTQARAELYTGTFEAIGVIVIVLILESSLLWPFFVEALNQGKMLANTKSSLKEAQIKREISSLEDANKSLRI